MMWQKKARGTRPPETFPQIGTLEDPALEYADRNLVLAYVVAPVSGGGVAVVRFTHVVEFRLHPLNIEGLRKSEYPVRPWEFTEVLDSDKTTRWNALKMRFWTVSFEDYTLEVVFEKVEFVGSLSEVIPPALALRNLHSHR